MLMSAPTKPRPASTSPAEERFVRQWLYGAAAVTVVRLLNAADPGKDLGRQILAAQNLLAGRGLSYFEHPGPDLAPATTLTMTGFSAGYSFIAAALYAAGLDVSMVTRLLPAVATMIGWWGWARLARPFFGPALDRGAILYAAAMVVATVTPLLFTIAWTGTDIFLWAAAPWFVECLVRGADSKAPSGTFDYLAGVVAGLAVLMRYASAFLPLYGGVVMLWQSWRQPQNLARRWSLFALGLLPPLAVQVTVNYYLSNTKAMPGSLLDTESIDVFGRLAAGLSLLHMWNTVWAFWVPGRIMSVLFPEGLAGLSWQLGLAVVGLALLVVLARIYGKDSSAGASRDPRVVSLGLLVMVPAMLLASMVLGSYDFVSDARYYWPVLPLSVLVAASLAAMNRASRESAAARVIRLGSRFYLAGYVAVAVLYTALMLAPGRIGITERGRVLGGAVLAWPSLAVSHELSPARQLVVRLLNERPGALLVTPRSALFLWDPAVDRSRIVELSCPLLQAKYVTGPVEIVLQSFDRGEPSELWYYDGNGLTGGLHRSDCFERLPGLRVVQRFPDEGLKVMEARVDSGQRVVLRP